MRLCQQAIQERTRVRLAGRPRGPTPGSIEGVGRRAGNASPMERLSCATSPHEKRTICRLNLHIAIGADFESIKRCPRSDLDVNLSIRSMGGNCILINTASSDEALAYMAAGPLEDLFKKHGPVVIDCIENESEENARAATGAQRRLGP